MKPLLHILIFLTIAALPSCTNEIFNNIVRINYGTSFGECVGFCKREVKIKSVNATFNCYSWYPTTQTVTNTLILESTTLDSISRLNTTSFFELPEVIGCPDCADGGAEWLEIELSTGETHKVTFEYSKEPEFIKPQIERLRKMLSDNNCNEN